MSHKIGYVRKQSSMPINLFKYLVFFTKIIVNKLFYCFLWSVLMARNHIISTKIVFNLLNSLKTHHQKLFHKHAPSAVLLNLVHKPPAVLK